MFPDALRLGSLQSALADDLLAFAPELVLAAAAVLLPVARMVLPKRVHLLPAATAAAGLAFAVALVLWLGGGGGEAFTGLVKLDAFAAFFRVFLTFFAVVALLLVRFGGQADAADSADFAVLLLGAVLGMLLMADANHLLTVFLAVEMASLPGYVLAGFRKGSPRASEAALKYVIYGAAASAVMLYGLTLLAGRCGGGYFPTVALHTAGVLKGGGFDFPLAAALLFTFAGFGFKLAVVPFHAWLPDVFEGATAEVGAVLSVGSKAAAAAVVLRFVLKLHAAAADAGMPFVFPHSVGLIFAVAAAVTVTFGNLLAFAQTDLKRLFAYSTVAHAGVMLAGIATFTKAGAAAVLVYLVGYLFMNTGVFAVVVLLRNATGTEKLSAVRGLVGRSPAAGVAFAVCVAGLIGLPPTAGFAGKFQVFAALTAAAADASRAGFVWESRVLSAVFGVLVLNTVAAAGYYLKLLRAAGLDEPDPPAGGIPAGAAAFVAGLAILLLAAGIFWDPIAAAAMTAVE